MDLFLKIQRKYRELPAKVPRRIFPEKIIPSGASPGNGKPFIFPNSEKLTEGTGKQRSN
tara:strand:- start:149 stop:325 length:177 start_codon:yes stop_codon:yes gene_type:complete